MPQVDIIDSALCGVGADIDKAGPMFAGQTRIAELQIESFSNEQLGAVFRSHIGIVVSSIGCEDIHRSIGEARYRASNPSQITQLMIPVAGEIPNIAHSA